MPTILSHAAVPLAIGIGLGSSVIPRRLLVLGIAASMLPDIDVYLSHYTSSVGHRGVTHSLGFACAFAIVAAAIAPEIRLGAVKTFVFIFIATASHGLLDAFTNGGSGITLLWPYSHERYFAPWRVIEVSPLGFKNFFAHGGLDVLVSELIWIWPAAALLAAVLYACRRIMRPPWH